MKTILITGGSKGIGKCVVEEAIANDYKVVFTYNKSKKAANALCKKFKDKCSAVKVDLESAKDRNKLFQFIRKILNGFLLIKLPIVINEYID